MLIFSDVSGVDFTAAAAALRQDFRSKVTIVATKMGVSEY